ncbi:MAG: hypothetical protein WEF86_11955 [Gemmatimonadota bacterium]
MTAGAAIRGPAGRSAGRRTATVVIVLLVASFAADAARAVSISPIAVYIDARMRTGALMLHNDGILSEEIEIDFAFGYPISDSSGNITVQLVHDAPPGEPSLVPWISAFPRRMLLVPGQRQVVRMLVEPPAGLADGEYWARVLIRSRGGQPTVERHRADGGRIQLAIETVVAVPVSYRQGHVATGIRLDHVRAVQLGDTVTVSVDLSRTGNAAFLGRLQAEILAGDRVVGSSEVLLGVYRSLRQVVRLPVPAGVTAPLTVRLLLDTNRDDLPDGGVLYAPAVSRSVIIETPP